jgi:ketosteroid isomerase-like protein
VISRRTVIVGAALSATPALAHPPSILIGPGEQGVKAEIEDIYKALASAVAARDVGRIKALYAENFTHIHTSAKADGRDARIVSLLSGEATVELLPFTERTVTIHAGGWAAIVRGVTPIRSAADGKTWAVHWTQTLTRTETGWQFAASQATRGRELTN